MNRIFTRIIMLCFALMMNTVIFAQEKPEMADVMRSNGKIYVVVAVCLTILIGLFIYVMLVDIRIRKMERENRL